MKMMWSGNITLKMDENEATYSLDSIEVKRYARDTLALEITGIYKRAKAVTPISRQ